MKYHCVQIKKGFDNKWEAFFTEDDQERYETESSPHPLGFYYYPITMSKARAFGKLKRFLEKKHEEMLEDLEHSYNELSILTCPKTKK